MYKNLIFNTLNKFWKIFYLLFYLLKNIKCELWFSYFLANVYDKNRQVTEKIYLRVKNDVPEDGGAVLINSAQIYCGAMDQAEHGVFGLD